MIQQQKAVNFGLLGFAFALHIIRGVELFDVIEPANVLGEDRDVADDAAAIDLDHRQGFAWVKAHELLVALCVEDVELLAHVLVFCARNV